MRKEGIFVVFAVAYMVCACSATWLDQPQRKNGKDLRTIPVVAIYHYFRHVDAEGVSGLEGKEVWAGTGFFVGENLVATAGHLVPIPIPTNDEQINYVYRHSVIVVKVKPLGEDRLYLTGVVAVGVDNRDIALLRVYGYRAKSWLKIGKPKVGKCVFVAFRELEDEANPVPVRVNAFITTTSFPQSWGFASPQSYFVLLLIPTIWHGASGGPVLQGGKVVGILVGYIRQGTIVEPATPLLKFVSRK